MPRIECSVMLATDCEGWWDGPAPDPTRAPICRRCWRLMCEAMETE